MPPSLSSAMNTIGDFDISVSAYPEKHPESSDFATDIDMLKRKVDNGATRAITQFFFDNDLYEAYVERARRAGIYIPIVPGILPVHNFSQVANFSVALRDASSSMARRALRWVAKRPADACARGVSRCCRAGHGSDGARGGRFPLLHDEPRRSCLRDLSHDRYQASPAGRASCRIGCCLICGGCMKRPAVQRAFLCWLPDYLNPSSSSYQGNTPMIRAPIMANDAHIISAFIGRVSPMSLASMSRVHCASLSEFGELARRNHAALRQ